MFVQYIFFNMILRFLCFWFVFVIIYQMISSNCFSGAAKVFPSIFNIAEKQTVDTFPTQSTCGIPTPNAFCKSTEQQTSVLNCQQAFCVQDCLTRTSLPEHVDILALSDSPACATLDYIDVRGRETGRVAFTGEEPCVIQSSISPTPMTENGAFTIVLWIWLSGKLDERFVDKH